MINVILLKTLFLVWCSYGRELGNIKSRKSPWQHVHQGFLWGCVSGLRGALGSRG